MLKFQGNLSSLFHQLVVYPLLSGSKMEVNVGAEVTFLLPEDQTCHFERFFAELERDQYMLGIETYGLSITTMEEVCTTRLSKYTKCLNLNCSPFAEFTIEQRFKNHEEFQMLFVKF